MEEKNDLMRKFLLIMNIKNVDELIILKSL